MRTRGWSLWMAGLLWTLAPSRAPGQACVGGSPLRPLDVAVGMEASLTEVSERWGVAASVRPIGPLVLRGALGRRAYRDETSSTGWHTLTAMGAVTPLPRWAVQACALGERHSSSVAGGEYRVTEWSLAAGAGRLVGLGSALSVGPWAKLSRVHATITTIPGAEFPQFEERFTRGSVGLAVTVLQRATVRVYYEAAIGYTEPAGYTSSESIASDQVVGISLAFSVPRP